MKETVRNLFVPAAVLFLTVGAMSCSREEEPDCVGALPPKKSAILKHIADHKKERTRSGSQVQLEPVVYQGDTVMYVANYGEGWEVFSNSTTMPMVIMRSEIGHFDASTLASNPAFAAFFDLSKVNLAIEMNDASAEAQPGSEEWADYGVHTCDGGPQRKPAPETMVLVGIGNDAPVQAERTEHLIKTRWSQSWPYNQYIPFSEEKTEENIHVVAGCGAVAAAQYLYYYHNKFGLPVNSVTSATYLPSINRYTFSGNSSTIWDSMPLGDGLYLPADTDVAPAALLIGFAANGVNTDFATSSQEESYSYNSEIAAFINKQTNQNLAKKNFSTSTVYNQIVNTNKPVLTSLNVVNSDRYHMVIIDDVKKVKYGKEYIYAPSSAVANVQNPTIHYGTTLEAMRALYGNGVTSEITYTSVSYYFRANWGWGRFTSDPEISGSLLTVTNGKDDYKAVTMIN